MLRLQELIQSMENATVFGTIETNKYSELGQVLGYLYHTQVTELKRLCEIIVFEFNHIIQSDHLHQRANSLTTLPDPDCMVRISFDALMISRVAQYVEYLQTNWVYPAPPKLDQPWTMAETAAFNKIINKRTLTPRQLEEIKKSQKIEFYRQKLGVNFKQRSDSLAAALEVKQYLTMIKHSLSDVIKLHRACIGGPAILKQLVFDKCQHVLHDSSYDTFTLEDYSCTPARGKITITAKIHKLTTYLDTQANEIVLIISVAWGTVHYVLAYTYVARLLYRRCMKRKGKKNYGRGTQQNNTTSFAPPPDESMGSDLKNYQINN